MAERQLRLFAHPKPLLDRLGRDFFRAVPKRPGVYVMTGTSGQILYIGQSGNLRARLGTYKNAHPDHLSRRTLRLIHSVSSITWEECATDPTGCRLPWDWGGYPMPFSVSPVIIGVWLASTVLQLAASSGGAFRAGDLPLEPVANPAPHARNCHRRRL